MEPFELAVAADFLEENGFSSEVASLLRKQQALRMADRYDLRRFAVDAEGQRHEVVRSTYETITRMPLPESQRTCHADDFPSIETRLAIPETVLAEVDRLLRPYRLTVIASTEATNPRDRRSPPPPRPSRAVY